jgi:hypothetical protein
MIDTIPSEAMDALHYEWPGQRARARKRDRARRDPHQRLRLQVPGRARRQRSGAPRERWKRPRKILSGAQSDWSLGLRGAARRLGSSGRRSTRASEARHRDPKPRSGVAAPLRLPRGALHPSARRGTPGESLEGRRSLTARVRDLATDSGEKSGRDVRNTSSASGNGVGRGEPMRLMSHMRQQRFRGFQRGQTSRRASSLVNESNKLLAVADLRTDPFVLGERLLRPTRSRRSRNRRRAT